MDVGVVLLPGHFLLFYSLEVTRVPYKSPDSGVTSVPLKCHSNGVGDREGGMRVCLWTSLSLYFQRLQEKHSFTPPYLLLESLTAIPCPWRASLATRHVVPSPSNSARELFNSEAGVRLFLA